MRAGPAAELLRSCPCRCPPRTFLPALCKIFLDESAPDNVLEVTARAITYYLDVSAECTRRIVGVDGAIKALCNRLVVVELNNRTSRDLAEQCVKVGGRSSYPPGDRHVSTEGKRAPGLRAVSSDGPLYPMTLTKVEVKIEPGDVLWKGFSGCVSAFGSL